MMPGPALMIDACLSSPLSLTNALVEQESCTCPAHPCLLVSVLGLAAETLFSQDGSSLHLSPIFSQDGYLPQMMSTDAPLAP